MNKYLLIIEDRIDGETSVKEMDFADDVALREYIVHQNFLSSTVIIKAYQVNREVPINN